MTKPRGCNLEKQADISPPTFDFTASWSFFLSVLFTSTHLSFQIVSALSSFPDFLFSRSPRLVISLPRSLRPLTVCWLNKWLSFILRERPGLMKTWSPGYGVIFWSLRQRWMVFFLHIHLEQHQKKEGEEREEDSSKKSGISSTWGCHMKSLWARLCGTTRLSSLFSLQYHTDASPLV